MHANMRFEAKGRVIGPYQKLHLLKASAAKEQPRKVLFGLHPSGVLSCRGVGTGKDAGRDNHHEKSTDEAVDELEAMLARL